MIEIQNNACSPRYIQGCTKCFWGLHFENRTGHQEWRWMRGEIQVMEGEENEGSWWLIKRGRAENTAGSEHGWAAGRQGVSVAQRKKFSDSRKTHESFEKTWIQNLRGLRRETATLGWNNSLVMSGWRAGVDILQSWVVNGLRVCDL